MDAKGILVGRCVGLVDDGQRGLGGWSVESFVWKREECTYQGHRLDIADRHQEFMNQVEREAGFC